MVTVDPNVLARGFLRHAERQPNPRIYLEDLHAKAVAAVAGGDRFVTATSFDGTSSELERKFESTQLLQVMEICLAHLDAEEEGEVTDGSVTIGDFSCRRSEWG